MPRTRRSRRQRMEGVETAEELRGISSCGIESMQGYFFARQIPADEVPQWLVKICPERLRAMIKVLTKNDDGAGIEAGLRSWRIGEAVGAGFFP